VIHKPAGVIVSGNKFTNIVNALPSALRKSDKLDVLLSPHPAHRLDFATSGVLVVAKTKIALLGLQELFKTKNITKTYHAVVINALEQKEGSINQPIDDKPSETHYQTLATETSVRFGYLNLVELLPITGRRHQLRKHMLFLGNPILGDAKYCAEENLLKGKGLYLQASSISFVHPVTSKTVNASLPLPKKFKKIFSKMY